MTDACLTTQVLDQHPGVGLLQFETICVWVNPDFFIRTSWLKICRKFYFQGVRLTGGAYADVVAASHALTYTLETYW